MSCSVRFTFIRHAETESNAFSDDLLHGLDPEVQLTSNGKQQAKRLGLFFKQSGIVFTHAYTSQTLRTRETARLCFIEMGCSLSITGDQRISERDVGDWEGLKRAVIYERPDVKEARTKDVWNQIPGDSQRGESHCMVAKRMYEWLKEKIEEYSSKDSDQHIIVFSHALAIKCLLAEVLDLNKSTAWREDVNPVTNTSVTELFFRNKQALPELIKRNNVEHLKV